MYILIFSTTKGFLSTTVTIFVNFYAYLEVGVLNRGKGDLVVYHNQNTTKGAEKGAI